jgi:hypothetical protein
VPGLQSAPALLRLGHEAGSLRGAVCRSSLAAGRAERAAIDAWIAAQEEERLSRPEAIRRLVEMALEGGARGNGAKQVFAA